MTRSVRTIGRWPSRGAAAGLIMLAVACADSATGPIQGAKLSAPTSAITTTNVRPAGSDWGDVRVCKTVTSGSPSIDFTFQVSVNGGAATTRTVAAGTCVVVFKSNVGGAFLDVVVVTENAITNWTNTILDIERYVPTFYIPPASPVDAFNLGTRTATVVINNDMVRTITYTNRFDAPPPPGGNDGCTPGYWKQEHHFDSWPAAYDPSDSFNATFGIGTNWFSNSFSLLDGLKAKGGQKNALARHAVAALLNGESGFYPVSTSDVIARVQAAYNGTAIIELTHDFFATRNELGCPLN